MSGKINVGIIGAGRIGMVHAKNIKEFIPEINIVAIADPYLKDESKEKLKELKINSISKDPNTIIDNNEIDAVLICSSTDTHSQFIIEAAKKGKHIFCEKPIDYDLEKVHEAIDTAKGANVKLQIGFCRRFDKNHRGIYEAIQSKNFGRVQLIKITSRDPEPPPIEYVKKSGGIFYDMMVHDFDMARFLANSEVIEVSATGTVLIDPEIGKADDYDIAIVTLKFENGVIATIDNSRKAIYGYDQRIEVLCSEGLILDENEKMNTIMIADSNGEKYSNTNYIMWDRYSDAFILEIKEFARSLIENTDTLVTGEDGLHPILMAAAALKSIKEKRTVKISEIE